VRVVLGVALPRGVSGGRLARGRAAEPHEHLVPRLRETGGGVGVQARLLGALQDRQGGLGLVEVQPRAGGDDGELGALGGAQRRRCLGDDRQGAVRTPEPALAVGLDGSVSVDAREPADRPQLAQRLGVATGGVGGERRGLADDVDPPRTAHGRLGVLVGLLRVVLEHPSRHDEVLRDALGVRLRQGAQPGPCCPVELCGLHALGDLRLRGPVGTGRTRLRAVAVVTSRPPIAEAASAAGAVVTGAVVTAGTAVAAGTPTARPVLATGTAAAPVPVASPPVVTTPSPPGPTIGAPTAPAGTLRLGAALTPPHAAPRPPRPL